MDKSNWRWCTACHITTIYMKRIIRKYIDTFLNQPWLHSTLQQLCHSSLTAAGGRIILTPNENLGTTPAPRQTSQSRQQAAFIESRAQGVLERQQKPKQSSFQNRAKPNIHNSAQLATPFGKMRFKSRDCTQFTPPATTVQHCRPLVTRASVPGTARAAARSARSAPSPGRNLRTSRPPSGAAPAPTARR